MQNIKKIIYYSTVAFTLNSYSIYSSLSGLPEFGESTEKCVAILAPSAERIATLLTSLGIKSLDVGSKTVIDLAQIAAPTAEHVTQIAGDSLVGVSSKIGVESVEKLAAVGEKAVVVAGTIAGVVVAVYSVTQLYPIGKEIAAYSFPSEEQKVQQAFDLKNAQNKLKALEAEEQFRDCLVKNTLNFDRGTSGLPRVCQALADTFAHMGKYAEVEQATAYFNKYKA